MFSLQRTIGRDDEFCALLEASAQQGVNSVRELQQIITHSTLPNLEQMVAVRQTNKAITEQISELLATALVVSLEREDVEHLADVLYKIPKTVEKFAERYRISFNLVRSFDFKRQVALLEEGTTIVLAMARSFRVQGHLSEIKRLHERLLVIESDGDEIALELMEVLYGPDFPPLTGIVIKDLIELNQKVVDRCQEAGEELARITIRTS